MITSYINEHTAEYYLVPTLMEILQKKYKHVSPIFPWVSREFNKLSRLIHKDDKFYVLIMFPRRPKLYNNEIYITFNEELERFFNIAKMIKVPIILGCPLANNIWELSERKCLWVELEKVKNEGYYIPVSYIEEEGLIINEKDIYNLVEKSIAFNFLDFYDFVRKLRENKKHYIYGDIYKPVYFLIKI
ncbi:hypothetical protein [Acinetobacter baumannii]|uniref:hypothetical protein n=1 Tax=Acinetobacter baumannii TaxID=470 RepID=UPI002F32B97F